MVFTIQSFTIKFKSVRVPTNSVSLKILNNRVVEKFHS
ncbi:hypothetical protein LEP1GSC021_0372 [Leptospira noguchii str. 1993005606]|uniref:Uncharacterized protein n=1 Tax=Leptospira noguchii str. 2001034031 TaxID=1193053 RepID=M6Y226_9LEPT|nr:hypothetical protein LEP1GSC024_4406 [Leptospira noguchii str. 2001034031]EPE82497.1 hypothetical protein LEP1GSC021_0372 [Leptospira noguchii str. 1993005606]